MSEVIGPGGVPIKSMGPSKDITHAIQIWKGAPKIGKTSTAAALGTVSKKYGLGLDPFMMLFEPGSGGVTINATSEKCPLCKGTGGAGKKKCKECGGVGTVRHILSGLDEIEKWFEWATTTDYNPIIIDTGDAMFQAVMDGVCVKLDIPSPHAAGDHGIAWSVIFDTMRGYISTLVSAGKGVIIIMHVSMQERRVKGGGIIQTAVFNISGKSRTFLASLANQILHFDVVPDPDSKDGSDKNIIVAAPTAGVEAGDQWGLFPAELDRGNSPEEAAEAILECFGYLESERK